MAGGYPAYPGYPSGGGARRNFFIVSELNGKVLDIEGEKKTAGAELCVWDKHVPAKPNQLWYTDGAGHIRSALNDMTFSNNESGHHLKTEPGSGNPRSEWRFEGNKIVNRAGECMDIKGQSKSNGADVISYAYKNQANQHWRQEYA